MVDSHVSNDQSSLTVDFSGLILGFSSAALYYMGESALEGKSVDQKNLPLARQNVDIIRLLREKTHGNLTEEEDKLIQQLIVDLQVKLVDSAK